MDYVVHYGIGMRGIRGDQTKMGELPSQEEIKIMLTRDISTPLIVCSRQLEGVKEVFLDTLVLWTSHLVQLETLWNKGFYTYLSLGKFPTTTYSYNMPSFISNSPSRYEESTYSHCSRLIKLDNSSTL